MVYGDGADGARDRACLARFTMKKATLWLLVLVVGSDISFSALISNADLTIGRAVESNERLQRKSIFIRTEIYPRPPYSGATYYIYERDDKPICTKLEVCNKFNRCSTTYKKEPSRNLLMSKLAHHTEELILS